MLLSIALLIAFFSAFIEIKAVDSLKPLETLYTKGFILPGIWYNFAFSLALSAVMGIVFSAGGVTIMLAGVMSTGLSAFFFRTKAIANANGYTYKGVKVNVAKVTTNLQANKAKHIQTAKDVVKMIKVIIHIFIFPITAVRAIIKWCVQFANALQAFLDHFSKAKVHSHG